MKRKTAESKNNGFEGVVEGASNKAAVAAAKRVAAGPVDDSLNPLVLVGPFGCGKTRILNAIAAEVASMQDGRAVISTTGRMFFEDYLNALRNTDLKRFRAKYKMADLLIVDDADEIEKGRHFQSEALGIFDEIIEDCRQVVVALKKPFKKIKKIDGKFMGRIDTSATIKLDYPDEAMKRRYIKLYLSMNSATLPRLAITNILDSTAKSFWEVKDAVCTALAENRR